MNKLFDLSKATIKQKIIIAVIILVLLIVLTNLFANLSKTKKYSFDYNEVNGEKFEVLGTETKDRYIYWTLENILLTFMRRYGGEISIATDQINYSIDEYYKVLSEPYKKYMSLNTYKQKVREMLNKFVSKDETSVYLKNENVINKIFIIQNVGSDNPLYLCELNTLDGDTMSYIGFELNELEQKYYIFYIE